MQSSRLFVQQTWSRYRGDKGHLQNKPIWFSSIWVVAFDKHVKNK